MVPKLDIFSGTYPGKDAVWLEAAESLAGAYERMKELAKQRPGPYFIFNVLTNERVAYIKTPTLRCLVRREVRRSAPQAECVFSEAKWSAGSVMAFSATKAQPAKFKTL